MLTVYNIGEIKAYSIFYASKCGDNRDQTYGSWSKKMLGLIHSCPSGLVTWGSSLRFSPATSYLSSGFISCLSGHAGTASRMRSRTLMYVNIISVSFVEDVTADIDRTKKICTSLQGSGAVADEKTETERRLDVIGYTICFDTERVAIAQKNFLKALHGFAKTDVTAKMKLWTAQRFASWGNRYCKMRRAKRLFCSYLSRNTWGRTESHAPYQLPEETIVAVKCWRDMLSLVRFRKA
jgi:hypothetical protein